MKQNNTNWKDKLTSYNGQTITYDSIGNPLSYRDGMSFTWQNGRQLASLQNGAESITYKYNESGIRTKKTVNGIDTLYYLDDSGNILCETTGNNSIYYYLGPSGNVEAINYNGTKYSFNKNLQGDVIEIIDLDGNTVAKYRYDAWGKVVAVLNASDSRILDSNHIGNINPIRYRGYYYDIETGFYLTGTRYYDPVVGRFINADGYVSTGQGLAGNNMFSYCGNNPVMRADPSGQFFISAIFAVAVVVATAVTLSGCSSNKTTNNNTPRTDIAKAPDLNRSTASQYNYNCYGNAISKEIRTNPSGYKRGDSTSKTFEAVKKDVGSKNVRKLSSANDSINDNENLVALKCGPMDYHFMVRVDNVWYNKPGTTPLISNESLDIVTANKWMGRYLNNNGVMQSDSNIYYDDETIFFAISKGWDNN